MEETYWKQFMATGKVEDYLHFKGVSNIEEKKLSRYEGMNQRNTVEDKLRSDRNLLK